MTFIFNTTAFIGEKLHVPCYFQEEFPVYQYPITPKFGYDFINYTRIIVLYVITIPQLHHFNK